MTKEEQSKLDTQTREATKRCAVLSLEKMMGAERLDSFWNDCVHKCGTKGEDKRVPRLTCSPAAAFTKRPEPLLHL